MQYIWKIIFLYINLFYNSQTISLEVTLQLVQSFHYQTELISNQHKLTSLRYVSGHGHTTSTGSVQEMAPVNWHQAAYSVDQYILHFGMTGIISISYHTLSIPTILNFIIQYNKTQCIHTFTIFLLPVTIRTYQTVLFKELHIC